MSNSTRDEIVQHGTEDTADDTKKSAELEALGSGAAGALMGSPLGAMGGVVGALLGSSINSVASDEPMQPINFEGDWNKYSSSDNDITSANDSTAMNSDSDTSS